MISSSSASIGETVHGRPLPGFESALGSGAGKKRKILIRPGPRLHQPRRLSRRRNADRQEPRPSPSPDPALPGQRRYEVGKFCDAIGMSNYAYTRFMQQSGRTKGLGSDIYQEAWALFSKREMAGLKMPTKNQKTANASTGSGSVGRNKDGGADISGIHLPGDEHDAVSVYDTCDEVRKKFTARLGKAEVTKAQFCWDLYAQLQSHNKSGKLQSSQLDRFRGNKGPTSSVHYVSCRSLPWWDVSLVADGLLGRLCLL